MKILLLFGLFLVCALNTVYAQKRETKEVTVRDHTYKVITIENPKEERSIWIEKATDTLIYLDPGFHWDKSMEIKYDRTNMEQLVKKYFTPVLKQSGLSFDNNEALFMSIIFDFDGNLQELTINFTGEQNIPMEVVDDFFNAALSSGIKCTFKKDHGGLKKARFIYINTLFGLKEMLE